MPEDFLIVSHFTYLAPKLLLHSHLFENKENIDNEQLLLREINLKRLEFKVLYTLMMFFKRPFQPIFQYEISSTKII